MRLDLSINIPTIITVITSIAAVCAFGVGLYSDLDKSRMRTDIAIVEIRARIDKTESNLTNLKTEQAVQTQTLRTDMKSDIGEIKDLLNRLIFGGSPAQAAQFQQNRQLNEWKRK